MTQKYRANFVIYSALNFYITYIFSLCKVVFVFVFSIETLNWIYLIYFNYYGIFSLLMYIQLDNLNHVEDKMKIVQIVMLIKYI